jgi:hypothetical protein
LAIAAFSWVRPLAGEAIAQAQVFPLGSLAVFLDIGMPGMSDTARQKVAFD